MAKALDWLIEDLGLIFILPLCDLGQVTYPSFSSHL
jgi:hypothetical protein